MLCTAMLPDNKYVGPPYSRINMYAARMSYVADDPHRPPLHCFAVAARAGVFFLGGVDFPPPNLQFSPKLLTACVLNLFFRRG